MKSISDIQYTVRSKGDKRNEVFDYFFDRLYPDWLSYKKLNDNPKSKKTFQKFLAIKIGHVSVHDLIGLKGMCLDSEKRGGNFARFFYGRFKIKK